MDALRGELYNFDLACVILTVLPKIAAPSVGSGRGVVHGRVGLIHLTASCPIQTCHIDVHSCWAAHSGHDPGGSSSGGYSRSDEGVDLQAFVESEALAAVKNLWIYIDVSCTSISVI